jgi:NAD(P)-dependent dehydrogenase (short-subunit alcohol dehydrogenase family)
MVQRFTDQVAIVTGGSRGIGRAIVERLTDEGAHVVIAGLNEEGSMGLGRAIPETGGRAEFIRTDVTSCAELETMVEDVLNRLGRIHVLVNNAGVHDKRPFCEEPEELWERMDRVNVSSKSGKQGGLCDRTGDQYHGRPGDALISLWIHSQQRRSHHEQAIHDWRRHRDYGYQGRYLRRAGKSAGQRV